MYRFLRREIKILASHLGTIKPAVSWEGEREFILICLFYLNFVYSLPTSVQFRLKSKMMMELVESRNSQRKI